MVLSRALVLSVALAWAGLTSGVGAAFAAPVPDSAAALRIQTACDAARRLRITTTGGIQESDRVVVDPGGLRIPSPGRPALLTVGNVPAAGRLVPWAEVVRLDSERSRAGKGALLFGVFALVPTAIGIGRHGPDLITTNDKLALLFGAAAVVAAVTLGALIGASQPDLHRIYP